MSGFWLGLSVLAVIALAVAVVRLKRFHDRQALLQERILTSETFLCVKPLLDRCRTLRVESIVFRPDAVIVKLFTPPGKVLKCVFEEHGLDEVGPEPLLALAQVAAE